MARARRGRRRAARCGRARRAGRRVFWCAGAGVVGDRPEVLDAEVAVLEGFLDGVAARAPGQRGFFFASSAGGVYAGSSGSPFTEHTDPAPLSPYGQAKLRSEQLATDFAARTGTAAARRPALQPLRPGQDLAKPQGLVSAAVPRPADPAAAEPLRLAGHERDYLFVDDAAAMVVDALGAVDRPGARAQGAGERALHHDRRGARRPAPHDPPAAACGARDQPEARFQVADLRLRSVAWPPTVGTCRTPMSAGMAATLPSLGARLRPA